MGVVRWLRTQPWRTVRQVPGVSIAHNARSEADVDVDAVLAEAVAAGAKLIKPACGIVNDTVP